MDKERKKALRAEYDQRKPEMGIVCWQSGERRWIAVSTDAKADYNGTLFQLQLGSWPGAAKGLYRKPGLLYLVAAERAGL